MLILSHIEIILLKGEQCPKTASREMASRGHKLSCIEFNCLKSRLQRDRIEIGLLNMLGNNFMTQIYHTLTVPTV